MPKEVRSSVVERSAGDEGKGHTQGVVMEEVQLSGEVVVGTFEERSGEPGGACFSNRRERIEKQGIQLAN